MNNEYQTALPLDFPDEPQSRNAYDVPLTNEQIKQVLPKLKYREQIGNIGNEKWYVQWRNIVGQQPFIEVGVFLGDLDGDGTAVANLHINLLVPRVHRITLCSLLEEIYRAIGGIEAHMRKALFLYENRPIFNAFPPGHTERMYYENTEHVIPPLSPNFIHHITRKASFDTPQQSGPEDKTGV